MDTLLDYRASVNDQLTPDQRRELDEIEEMLSCAMIKKGITPKITSFQKLQTDSKFMLNVDIDELVRLYVRRTGCYTPMGHIKKCICWLRE